MPTEVPVGGNILLSGVTFSGTQGAPGSTLSWTGLDGADYGPDQTVTDDDDDGRLDAGVDSFGDPLDGITFSGYTVTVSGIEYPIFTDGVNFAIVVSDQTVGDQIATSGTSNTYQAETAETGVYLCFAAGTRITTPDGEAEVETLSVGGLVMTQDGRSVAVRWIGRQTLSALATLGNRRLVRISAGALGDGLPLRDLVVTGDHGMLVDGLVINASALVNGATIQWERAPDLPGQVTVYHVETDLHDVILAEGAPSETFVDYVGRTAFDNHAEYLAIYGAERIITEMPLPRITAARLLPAELKQRLGIRADAAAA